MSPFNRREFLNRTAILSAAVAAGTPLVRAEEKASAAKGSANDRLKVAVIGVRGRGMSHVGGYLSKNANCEITTVCDCDEAVIGPAMKKIGDAQKGEPKYVKDIRKVIEDKSIDVISIATPNHWHALAAVWAMRAGKHVYVEKPATHNVHEGRLMVQASRKYGKVCQVGTQSRSTNGMREAIAYIHEGNIGKVNLAYGTCYKPRGSIGKADGVQSTPRTMDYDLWCGPARVIQPTRNTKNGPVHYDWHWIWEYGNGDFGNQGVHEADKARWGLNLPGLPTSVVSIGGRFGYVDDGETPNTQLNLYEYPGAHIMFEVRGLNTKDYKGAKVGNIWFGDKGYVVCPNYSSGVAYTPDGVKVKEFKGGGDQSHFDNFLKAARANDYKLLNCDVEEGHLSAALCHLGNISYRLGTACTMDQPTDAFTGCKDAVAALERMKDHIKDNGVNLAEAKGLMGVTLKIDPKTEKFVGHAKANDMLFREYRKGFDIVEAV
ncbi:MAG: Gfo/Idh/MocA family oxidoreductase [Gemmataceae bacterium]|nr:Gfo/Idh/MocA family oxidoreductase [Gemmataceae bacterium]